MKSIEPISSWITRAKCRGLAADVPNRRYCRGCPVISECYVYAVVHQERGVWGGSNDEDRAPHALGIDLINSLREKYRQAHLLEERLLLPSATLLQEQEPAVVLQLELSFPTSQQEVYLESTPDLFLEELG
jgi:Transcription factor WhiB